jgi:arylsulfatase A-like enzyme
MRVLILPLTLILVLACSCAAALAEDAQPPNILLIVSDDQGYRDLGCYGSEEVKTPNLDRLAEQGVRLTQFYVTWPACTPSRGSLLTGRYPQRNGTYDMFRNEAPDYGHRYTPEEYAVTWEHIGGMDVREVLLPRLLQPVGYTSGIFGKWDLGELERFLPLARGFDDFYGFTNTGIDYYTHERYGVPSMRRGNRPTTEDQGVYCTDLFHREAARFIDGHHAAPFFCYVPYNAPHGASNLDMKIRGAAQAPRKWKELYPELIEHDDAYRTRMHHRYGREVQVPTRENRRLEYLGAVTCMDDSIGRLLDLLEERGVADRTIVIFFSDNGGGGGSDNDPLRGGKAQMFEGGLRVPCIVRWPGKIPPGTVCDEFLTSLEILPTLLAAAGAKPPNNLVLDGFDMLPVLQGKQPSPRDAMFWQRRGDRAARVGNWKWVDSGRGGGLFDLSNDVGEKHDLSDERPEVLRMVKQRFAAWTAEMKAAQPRRPFRDF